MLLASEGKPVAGRVVSAAPGAGGGAADQQDVILEPGSDAFSGSMTTPGDNAQSSCTWTWDFSRVK